jgi:hypothetical protein
MSVNRPALKNSADSPKPAPEGRPKKYINHYHDPLKLLKVYRDVRWNLKLSMEQHRRNFEEEYGVPIP